MNVWWRWWWLDYPNYNIPIPVGTFELDMDSFPGGYLNHGVFVWFCFHIFPPETWQLATAMQFVEAVSVSRMRQNLCGWWPLATPTACIDGWSFRGEKLGWIFLVVLLEVDNNHWTLGGVYAWKTILSFWAIAILKIHEHDWWLNQTQETVCWHV